MFNFKKPKFYIFILCLAFVFILYIMVCRLLLMTKITDSIMFILFMVVFILPGIVLVKWFDLQKTPLMSLVYAFTLSFVFLFTLYLVFAALKLMTFLILVPVIMLFFGIIGLIVLKNRPLYIDGDTNEFFIALSIAVISLFIVMFTLTAPNLNPSVSGPRQFHVDLLNSVGLVTSAVRGFPFEDVKAVEIPYVYHAVPFAFLGVMKSLCGFSSFDLITKYSLSVFTPFCVLALAALIKRLTKKNIYILLSFIILFILSPYENSFLYYMYKDTLGFSLSIAFGVISLLSFIDGCSKEEKVFSSSSILSLLSFAMTVATKGPVAVVFLIGFGFSFLFKLINDSKKIPVVILGLTYFLSFFAIYFLIYSNDTASLVLWYPGRFVYDTMLFKIVSNLLGHQSIALAITAMQFISYCFMSLAFVILLTSVIVRFKKTSPFVSFTLGAIVSGTLLTYFTHQYGGSEIYFILAAYAFSVVGVFVVIEQILSIRTRIKRILSITPVLVILIVLVSSSVSPAFQFFTLSYEDAILLGEGSPARVDDEYKLMAIDYKRFDYITDYEYEAMLWIKDNTPKDSIIVGDRVLINNKYMYYSAFSERSFFLEGYIYITSYDEESLYYDEIQKRVGILERLYSADTSVYPELDIYGYDYIVISTWQNPSLTVEGVKVFENRDISIYQRSSI